MFVFPLVCILLRQKASLCKLPIQVLCDHWSLIPEVMLVSEGLWASLAWMPVLAMGRLIWEPKIWGLCPTSSATGLHWRLAAAAGGWSSRAEDLQFSEGYQLVFSGMDVCKPPHHLLQLCSI